MKVILNILILLLCMAQGGSLDAQTKVTLSGVVKDRQGKPLSTIPLAIAHTSLGTYTDDDGRYSLTLQPGHVTVVVDALGYERLEKSIDLKASRVLNLVLEESSVDLGVVEVYGKSKNQQLKEGSFAVNAIDIRSQALSLSSLNDVVKRTAGVKVREQGGVGSDFDLSINGMSGNSVRYFIDGMPLDMKGQGVNLSNLPVCLIDRVEIYKGVVPTYLGSDALGGAVNIVTKSEQRNFVDASYSVGSFHTHKAELNAQYVEPHTGLILRPTVGVSYAKNDYKMRGVQVWDEASRSYIHVDRRRFHDDFFSLLGQVEAGFSHKTWADALFFTLGYSQVEKELQTGSVQSKVYGMAEREQTAWNIAARYQKSDLLLKGLTLRADLSHTWDASLTTDTAYRNYDWNGDYIVSSRNEITGRGRSMRHYKRPYTTVRTNLDYAINEQHRLNLNYTLSRTGNNRWDEVDESFEASDDLLAKHIVGFSYEQSLLDGRWCNTLFAKDYINHLHIEQKDLPNVTGSKDIQGNSTKQHGGYGVGSRFTLWEPLSLKASYERSVRLPLARELLGNGTTIYANVALQPELSHNVNGGLFGTWRPAVGHTLYYEAGGFLRYVDNYIQATVSEKEGMMQYTNQPAVHIKGVEGEVRYDWMERLRLSANASLQDARDQNEFKDDGKPSATYQNRVPNRPWFFANAEASYSFHNIGMKDSRLRLEWIYNYVHWFYLTWEAYGTAENKARIPTQHLCDAVVSYAWHRDRYSVSLTCSNLFDHLAYDNYKLQKPGRAFTAKFRLLLTR